MLPDESGGAGKRKQHSISLSPKKASNASPNFAERASLREEGALKQAC
jgi:hypothetical protein